MVHHHQARVPTSLQIAQDQCTSTATIRRGTLPPTVQGLCTSEAPAQSITLPSSLRGCGTTLPSAGLYIATNQAHKATVPRRLPVKVVPCRQPHKASVPWRQPAEAVPLYFLYKTVPQHQPHMAAVPCCQLEATVPQRQLYNTVVPRYGASTGRTRIQETGHPGTFGRRNEERRRAG